MAESQNIEYKESWRDEYLKWVCGFANAQGGTIYIGIDDAGNVVGVQNVKKLLEDIPNKIQTVLGIVSDVNKKTKDGKDYVEIRVEPSSYPSIIMANTITGACHKAAVEGICAYRIYPEQDRFFMGCCSCR